MNDEELLASVFPKKVRDKLKQIAHADKPKRVWRNGYLV